MCKRVRRHRLDISGHIYYRRAAGNVIYIRDREGRYRCFLVDAANGTISVLPSGVTTLGPIYNRINFANGVRFTAHTRTAEALERAYALTPAVQILTSGWQDLPAARSATRRTTNQGMNDTMRALTGAVLSATDYARWCDAQFPNIFDSTGDWEWCHLLAHAMGGRDGPLNVVSAVRGNNSEQLILENALQMYRHEGCFRMKITCARLGAAAGLHIGNVIRYKVRCLTDGSDYIRYLDCLNAPDPSAIHYFSIVNEFAIWANKKLLLNGAPPVTGQERHMIQQYIEDNS